MAIVDLEILERQPFTDAASGYGAYERIDAIAHYAVDPDTTANRAIVDLSRAERDESGHVRFSGDATFLLPTDRHSNTALVEMPNRGHRLAPVNLGYSDRDATETGNLDPGDGFLLQRGWTVAWCGWQWDVPHDAGRMRLAAPEAGDLGGEMQLRIQPNANCRQIALTDQHVGSVGNHVPIPAAPGHAEDARLLVRDGLAGEPRQLPRETWQFARDDNGIPVSDPNFVWLRDGFEAGRIYDLVYRPASNPVVGVGMLAARDFAAYLKTDSTLGAAHQHVIGTGTSQCGRFLRTLLYFGLNRSEAGGRAFDGLLVHVAGGRRGEFNHRYAQPSVQPTPSFGHRFPFADAPQADIASNQPPAGLLDRLSSEFQPKIIYTDTSSEYWRGDAGLSHLDLSDGSDVEPPPNVRRYLFSSTQHGAGAAELKSETRFGSRGANAVNVIDYRPLLRTALVNLFDWVVNGIEPPPSKFPRVADGNAAERDEVLRELAAHTALALPSVAALPAIRPLDLGPNAVAGVGNFPAVFDGDPYPCLVSTVDADGLERAGIRMPDVELPIGVHTGFNPRHEDTGAAGQILEYIGSTRPFDAAELDARYGSGEDGRATYLARIRTLAETLAAQRYLLADDVELCVNLAEQRFDMVKG